MKNYIKGVNLEMSFGKLNKILQNPMLIHRIQDNLMDLKGDSLLAEAIRNGAGKDLKSCIKMIVSQAKDNRQLITEIIGIDTMNLIAEYEGHDPNDIPDTLFNK